MSPTSVYGCSLKLISNKIISNCHKTYVYDQTKQYQLNKTSHYKAVENFLEKLSMYAVGRLAPLKLFCLIIITYPVVCEPVFDTGSYPCVVCG